jgi:hypothetical protein
MSVVESSRRSGYSLFSQTSVLKTNPRYQGSNQYSTICRHQHQFLLHTRTHIPRPTQRAQISRMRTDQGQTQRPSPVQPCTQTLVAVSPQPQRLSIGPVHAAMVIKHSSSVYRWGTVGMAWHAARTTRWIASRASATDGIVTLACHCCADY